MKLHPILFSTPMVQAILNGNKTQTRRVVKHALKWSDEWHVSKEGENSYCMRNGFQYSLPFFKCPYGKPGDILWVRESFNMFLDATLYKADTQGVLKCSKWKPSIHMPFTACRLFLKIKSIRVERLQSINETDAKAEGVESVRTNGIIYKDYWDPTNTALGPVSSFMTLWASIHGCDSETSFDRDPFVWVIEFERIENPKSTIN